MKKHASIIAVVVILVGLYTWAFVSTVHERDAEIDRLEALLVLAEAGEEKRAGQLRQCEAALDAGSTR